MRRVAVLVIIGSLFGLGASGCDPSFSCSSPQHLTGYHGTIQYSASDFVEQDVWTEQGAQTMDVCSISNWRANATQSGTAATGVKTYPSSEDRDTDYSSCASQTRLDSISEWSSTFSHSAPDTGAWDFAYDVWINGGPCGASSPEIMVWTQWQGISVPAAQYHPTIGTVAYDFFRDDAHLYYQFRQHTQTSSGSVDLLAIVDYMRLLGILDANDTRRSTKYGVEVLTTFGEQLPFWVDGFTCTGCH